MNKSKAKNYVVDYLKERNIEYTYCVSDGAWGIGLPLFGYEKCPDSILECCFYFHDTSMEARVYFDKNASSWIADNQEHWPQMYRLLNFINARFWPANSDGIDGKLYDSHHLVTPRFYITEDDQHDLTATMALDYDVFDMAPLEICDYVTMTLPHFMNELSFPLFMVLLGEKDADEAISDIKRDLLQE